MLVEPLLGSVGRATVRECGSSHCWGVLVEPLLGSVGRATVRECGSSHCWGVWVEPLLGSVGRATVGACGSSHCWGVLVEPLLGSVGRATVGECGSSHCWGVWVGQFHSILFLFCVSTITGNNVIIVVDDGVFNCSLCSNVQRHSESLTSYEHRALIVLQR